MRTMDQRQCLVTCFTAVLAACGGSSHHGSGAGGQSVGAGGSGNGTPGSTVGAGTGPASSSPTGSSPRADAGACGPLSSRIRITEVDLGVAVSYNEVDTPLTPLAISAIPSGGSRVGFMGTDHKAHLAALDANDALVPGSELGLTAFDFQDVYADDKGGVVLVSRPSAAAGTLNCGDPTNLCGTPPSPAVPCFDMYLVRFDGTSETWATKLTQSDATHPPYLTTKTDPNNIIFIWWYAHNGRIAWDGTQWAAYFGAAISVSQNGCVNIHQGDRMKLVSATGTLETGGFDWGCSHSGYERVVWDPAVKKFVTVCKNDAPAGSKTGRIAFAPNAATIDPVDLWYSDLGSILPASNGGYWIATSDIRQGQTASANGLADIHLLHVPSTTTPTPDKDILLASDPTLNDRGPHLAAYGASRMVAAWDTSSTTGDLDPTSKSRQFLVQILDRATGAPPTGSTSATAGPLPVSIVGSRYQDFRSYPDGSVAYVAPGSTATSVKVLRILPCSE